MNISVPFSSSSIADPRVLSFHTAFKSASSFLLVSSVPLLPNAKQPHAGKAIMLCIYLMFCCKRKWLNTKWFLTPTLVHRSCLSVFNCAVIQWLSPRLEQRKTFLEKQDWKKALVQRDFPVAAVNCGLESAKDLRGNEDNDEWRAYHRPLYLPSVFLPPKSYSKKTVAMVTGTKKGRVRISRFKREECAREAERERRR